MYFLELCLVVFAFIGFCGIIQLTWWFIQEIRKKEDLTKH